MQNKRQSFVDKNFMSSLRKYEESLTSRQMNTQKKEKQLQEQQSLIQDIQANILDLEHGEYIKCFTSLNLMFNDPNYCLRKHISFQLFVPDEKDFIGYTILNTKEIWILLLLYFDIVNQNKNQYSSYLWQCIIKKMSEYLNYELREEVINQVKMYKQKSKLSNNINKQPIQQINHYQYLQQNDDQNKKVKNINDNIQEICFDKSNQATLSDNSIIERSQILEQNIVIIYDQFDSATNEDASNQGPNNSSLDLNNDFVEITYHNYNPNDFQIQDIQQQSQTEDLLKNSIEQANNQVEVSLITQMEQLGLQDIQQDDQLNNAIIIDNDDDIQDNLYNLELESNSQISFENAKIQESSIYQQKFQEENKSTENLEDNKNIKNCLLNISNFENINDDQIQNSNQLCKRYLETHNSQNINQWTNGEQNNKIQQEEIYYINQDEQLAHNQAKLILKKDLESLENDSDNLDDQIETKYQEYERKKNQQNIKQQDIINIEFQQSPDIISSKRKTIEDHLKPKSENQIIYCNTQNEEYIIQDEFQYSLQNEKKRINPIMQAQNASSSRFLQIEEQLVPKRSSKRISYPERSDLQIPKMIIANNKLLNHFNTANCQSQQISEEINNKLHSLQNFDQLNKNNQNQIIILSKNQEHFLDDTVKIEIYMENINDNDSHHIVKILSGQLNGLIALAQIKQLNNEQIIFEDYNFYNNYLQFHQQSYAIYLPLGSYLINQN